MDIRKEGQRRHALVKKGRYKDAMTSLDKCIQKKPADALLYRERGHLHLYLDHPQLARSDFDIAARLGEEVFRTKPGRLHSDSEYNAIGVTYWMQEHRELALSFWRYSTGLLLQDRIGYSHMGGGIEAGLLLWFGAVQLRRADDLALVRTLYEKRLASKHWAHDLSSWPGPIVRFFLKQIDKETLIDAADCEERRCEAHFAMAARAREDRNPSAFKKHITLAAEGDNFYDRYNVFAYFMARHEASKLRR